MSLNLSCDTKAKMKALFGKERCCECNKPAERFRLNRFYCQNCIPVTREEKQRRKYRIPMLSGGFMTGRYGKQRTYLTRDTSEACER